MKENSINSAQFQSLEYHLMENSSSYCKLTLKIKKYLFELNKMVSSIIIFFLVFGLILKYWSNEDEEKEEKGTKTLPGPFQFPIIGKLHTKVGLYLRSSDLNYKVRALLTKFGLYSQSASFT